MSCSPTDGIATRAVATLKLDWGEMEERHRLVFEIHEEGTLTFEDYLKLVVFCEMRPFTRAQFRRFMCEQSNGNVPQLLNRAVEQTKANVLVLGHIAGRSHLGDNGEGYGIIRQSGIPVLSV
jgi:hypothetical protein